MKCGHGQGRRMRTLRGKDSLNLLIEYDPAYFRCFASFFEQLVSSLAPRQQQIPHISNLSDFYITSTWTSETPLYLYPPSFSAGVVI